MPDKFCVTVTTGMWDFLPDYFENFYNECQRQALLNDWTVDAVANYELKPLGGRLIKTKTQGWYLSWDDEKYHTYFVLKWT